MSLEVSDWKRCRPGHSDDWDQCKCPSVSFGISIHIPQGRQDTGWNGPNFTLRANRIVFVKIRNIKVVSDEI